MKRKIISVLLAMLLLGGVCGLAGCKGDNTVKLAGVYRVTDYGVNNGGKENCSDALKDLMNEAGFGAVLLFPKGVYRISDGVTFRKNVSLIFDSGASLSVDNGVTVTVQTASIDAGGEQIFSGEGSIDILPLLTEVRAEWFGAIPGDGKDDSAAIMKAFSVSSRVVFGEGVFTLDAPVNLASAFKTYVNEVSAVGKGSGKTIFECAPGISAIDSCTDTASTFLGVYDIGFVEKGGGKSSTAIKIKGPYSKIHGCDFDGFATGVYHINAYCCYMIDNTASDCAVAFEISDLSLYLYFENCVTEHCGTFIQCVVEPSGGISNAILVANCKSTDSTDRDVYITYNQAVWMTNCEFTGGTGGDCAVFFDRNADSGLENCVITSAPSAPERIGVYYSGTNYCSVTDSVISGNGIGIKLNGCNYTSITGNTVKDNATADMELGRANCLTVTDNSFMSEIPTNLVNTGTNRYGAIYENRFFCAEYEIAPDGDGITAENNSFGVRGEEK